MAKILLIANAESPHTRRWVEGLRSRGYELYLLSHADADYPEGVTLRVLPLTLRGFFKALPQVHALVREVNPHLVHGHQVIAEGLYAVWSGHPKVVVSAWGSDVLVVPKRSPIFRLLVQSVLRRSNAIIADSRDSVRAITDLVPDAVGKTHCFPMGVERHYANAARVLPQKEPIILSTRSLKPVYNIDLVIRAFALVSPSCSHRLIIAGDGPMREQLTELVAQLGVQDRVEFVGMVSRERLAQYYARSEIFVSIPRWDATSVSLLEAMNWGCFPIVSDLPANREWIQHNRNGLVVPPLEDELVLALRKAVECADLRRRAISLNQALVWHRAIWEESLDQVEAIYRQLLIR